MFKNDKEKRKFLSDYKKYVNVLSDMYYQEHRDIESFAKAVKNGLITPAPINN